MRIISGIVALLVATACNFNINVGNGKAVNCKGPVQDKELDLKGFDKVQMNTTCDIRLTQRDAFLVDVRANEEVFAYLDFSVEDGTLYLKTKDNVQIRAEEYELTIGLPLLKDFTVNGACDLEWNGGYYAGEDLTFTLNGAGDLELYDIQVPSLTLKVNGAADVEMDKIDVMELAVIVNGAGDVGVTGKADKAVFNVSGVGSIDASELDAGAVETHKAGVATIRTKTNR